MDPETAWKEMMEAAAARDWPQAEEFAQALLEWLAKGGFPPRTSPHEGLTREWHVEIAKAVCRSAIKQARARSLVEQGAAE